jgi:hypothetical protein
LNSGHLGRVIWRYKYHPLIFERDRSPNPREGAVFCRLFLFDNFPNWKRCIGDNGTPGNDSLANWAAKRLSMQTSADIEQA